MDTRATWFRRNPEKPHADYIYAALEIKPVAAAILYILKQHVAAVPIKGAVTVLVKILLPLLPLKIPSGTVKD